MVTIAVVDDEVLAVRVIEKLMASYTKVPFRLITAQSGKEALEKLRQESVDIMLVDIEMRGMDGFTLIEEVRKMYQRMIPVIMITAYSQFDYFKQAFGVRASDYILKPLKKVELHQALDKVIVELAEARKQLTLKEDGEREKVERALETWYQRGAKLRGLQALEVELHKYLPRPNYYCAVLRTNAEQGFIDEQDELQRWKFDIRGEYLLVPLHSDREWLWIGSIANSNEQERFVQEISHRKGRLSDQLALGISKTFHTLSDLKEQIESALKMARRQLLYSNDKKINVWSAEQQSSRPITQIEYQREELNKLIASLAIGNSDLTGKLDQTLFIGQNKDYAMFEETLIYFLLRLQKLAQQYSVKVSLLTEIESILASARNIEDVLIWIERQSKQIEIAMMSERSSAAYQNVLRTRQYIDEHYSESLSLDDVSAMAAVHPAYFCELFKKITSKTYISYLTELRIEKAKQLIGERKIKVIELAAKVGYEDPDYFRRVFRKHTGMSPKQYEKRNR